MLMDLSVIRVTDYGVHDSVHSRATTRVPVVAVALRLVLRHV